MPIFNALNNRGDDAKAFGELDDFGGHCGFLEGAHLRGFAERWVATRLETAADAAARATIPASQTA